MCNARIQSSKARTFDLQKVAFASNLRNHQEKASNLLESLDHAYVVSPNKIDEDSKANLIKSIFKLWPLF
jgi:hypothetical protein